MIKNLPAVQETQVQSLGQEDPLEEKMAMHSSILAWEILWTEGFGGLHTVHGVSRVGHDLATKQQKPPTFLELGIPPQGMLSKHPKELFLSV